MNYPQAMKVNCMVGRGMKSKKSSSSVVQDLLYFLKFWTGRIGKDKLWVNPHLVRWIPMSPRKIISKSNDWEGLSNEIPASPNLGLLDDWEIPPRGIPLGTRWVRAIQGQEPWQKRWGADEERPRNSYQICSSSDIFEICISNVVIYILYIYIYIYSYICIYVYIEI